MHLRKYHPSDCRLITRLFYDTVHSVNARDYTEEQLNVWASGTVNLDQWNQSFLEHYTVVAVEEDIKDAFGNNLIIGFGDIDKTGYLDRLYIHKDYQGKGTATAICNKLEQAVCADKITTHASITAKPFFLNRGYKIIKEQQVERGGILLTNYVMVKKIPFSE